MEFKVKEEEYNPLLKRKEITLEMPTEGKPTPVRLDIRKSVAAKYGTKAENVIVRSIETTTGTGTTRCLVEVYDEPAFAIRVLPRHIRNRNLPPEERIRKAKKEKKRAPAETPQAKK
jgi:ribosomal protein S24E